MDSATTIRFASCVPIEHRDALEHLVFFNSCQARVLSGIVEAIELFGAPEIASDRQGLRVRVSGCPEAQCLFALDFVSRRPIGVAVYTRQDVERVTVLHVGVAREFASGGVRSHEQLLLRLLRELRRSSRRMKGVRRLELYYLTGRAQARHRVSDQKLFA